MDLKQARYIGHFDRVDQLPFAKKEVAIIGRSNVGKSSLINHLTKKKSIAKTSKVPGKTKSIHVFDLGQDCTLADLPGYGFSKVSKKLQDLWSQNLDQYFKTRKGLLHALILIECKAKLTQLDKQMIDYLNEIGLPFSIIVTKMDKLNQSDSHKVKKELSELPIQTDWFFVTVKRDPVQLQAHIDGLFK